MPIHSSRLFRAFLRLCVVVGLVLTCSATTMGAERAGALGHILPSDGIIELAGPPGEIITRILIAEQQQVASGAPLVIFRGKVLLESERSLAELTLREAEETGGKAIAAQQLRLKELTEVAPKAEAIQDLSVESAKAQRDYARRALDRFTPAGGDSVSAQQLDERENALKMADLLLSSAMQELSRLTLSNDILLQQARGELKRLEFMRQINVQRAQEQLKLIGGRLRQAVLYAPSEGTVLEILQHEGESAGPGPIVRMADLKRMCVMADVYAGDLLKLAPGMRATINAKPLLQPLTGEVESIGRIISATDRTAKVKIRLDQSDVAARLINMEVDVTIDIPDK